MASDNALLSVRKLRYKDYDERECADALTVAIDERVEAKLAEWMTRPSWTPPATVEASTGEGADAALALTKALSAFQGHCYARGRTGNGYTEETNRLWDNVKRAARGWPKEGG